MNFTATLKPLVAAAALACAGQALAQVTFYEGEGFRGRALAANRTINNFSEIGFNDRASSVIVERGRWEVCEDAAFHGRCVVLRKRQLRLAARHGPRKPDLVRPGGEQQQRSLRGLRPAGAAAGADLRIPPTAERAYV